MASTRSVCCGHDAPNTEAPTNVSAARSLPLLPVRGGTLYAFVGPRTSPAPHWVLIS